MWISSYTGSEDEQGPGGTYPFTAKTGTEPLEASSVSHGQQETSPGTDDAGCMTKGRSLVVAGGYEGYSPGNRQGVGIVLQKRPVQDHRKPALGWGGTATEERYGNGGKRLAQADSLSPLLHQWI